MICYMEKYHALRRAFYLEIGEPYRRGAYGMQISDKAEALRAEAIALRDMMPCKCDKCEAERVFDKLEIEESVPF